MEFGAAMFFADYSMAPGELGQALETRGFESVWAPEHSHIPASRATPFPQGGELPKRAGRGGAKSAPIRRAPGRGRKPRS